MLNREKKTGRGPKGNSGRNIKPGEVPYRVFAAVNGVKLRGKIEGGV